MKREKRISRIMICVSAVAALVLANGLFRMVNMREEGDKNARYLQYVESSLAENITDIEYIDTAAASILEDGENCQVEISVGMQEGQVLQAEDEKTIQKMVETVLADQFSGNIIITFTTAG